MTLYHLEPIPNSVLLAPDHSSNKVDQVLISHNPKIGIILPLDHLKFFLLCIPLLKLAELVELYYTPQKLPLRLCLLGVDLHPQKHVLIDFGVDHHSVSYILQLHIPQSLWQRFIIPLNSLHGLLILEHDFDFLAHLDTLRYLILTTTEKDEPQIFG